MNYQIQLNLAMPTIGEVEGALLSEATEEQTEALFAQAERMANDWLRRRLYQMPFTFEIADLWTDTDTIFITVESTDESIYDI